MKRIYVVIALAFLGSFVCRSDVAHADGLRVVETSVRFGGGVDPSNIIEYYALYGDFGFRLWDSADRWFSDRNMEARWVIEPWVAYVDDSHGIHQTSSFEIAVSPLFGKLTFLADSRLRPFIEGGEGIVYTDLRKQRLGTRVQFSSQFGGGLEYQINDGLAFTIAARIRHISNAGMASSNPGMTAAMGLIGFTFR